MNNSRRRRGGVPEFARVPGWLVSADIFSRLTPKSKALLVVFYLHARKDDRKTWCAMDTLCAEAGISRRHVGLAKKELFLEGVIYYDVQLKGKPHAIWMATDAPYCFRPDPEDKDYIRSQRSTTKGLEGYDIRS